MRVPDLAALLRHPKRLRSLTVWRYIGPGLLVTVGFIDPGNWAANVAAGSQFGYSLLWMVTLSTVMLVFLQHNAAHLGIATGLCLAEAATAHLSPRLSRTLLASAVCASVSTALAEILGAAIALQMLFRVPIPVGALGATALVFWMLLGNSYRRMEKYIIGFVSLIGLSFMFELSLVSIPWDEALRAWTVPSIPPGAIPIVMSVLGAVVMPHNLFLHSEIIQSRRWDLADPAVIRHQLRYEFADTLLSMLIGWAINSAMILVAAATFFARGVPVTALEQAQAMLAPLLGQAASVVFAAALLLAGISSSVTAGMAGGTVVAGMYGESYDAADPHSRLGIAATLLPALLIIFFIGDPFWGLVVSQIVLSVQLPFTIFLQLRLTSSRKVMGPHANTLAHNLILYAIAAVVVSLNIMLLHEVATGGG